MIAKQWSFRGILFSSLMKLLQKIWKKGDKKYVTLSQTTGHPFPVFINFILSSLQMFCNPCCVSMSWAARVFWLSCTNNGDVGNKKGPTESPNNGRSKRSLLSFQVQTMPTNSSLSFFFSDVGYNWTNGGAIRRVVKSAGMKVENWSTSISLFNQSDQNGESRNKIS